MFEIAFYEESKAGVIDSIWLKNEKLVATALQGHRHESGSFANLAHYQLCNSPSNVYLEGIFTSVKLFG